ncbi:MAG TPA: hypothetical protein V6C97_19115 [Oculatellaceae cyanobacterium]
MIRQQDGPLAALAVDKLITFNMSPEWWQYFLKEDTSISTSPIEEAFKKGT